MANNLGSLWCSVRVVDGMQRAGFHYNHIVIMQNKIRHFLSSVSSLRASVAYSVTDQYIFITQKRNSCVLGLLANNTEYSFSISSREGHEVSNITLTQSPNAAANQLDIF